MRVIQKIVVILLAVFISAFFIPTVINIICNGPLRLDCWISTDLILDRKFMI